MSDHLFIESYLLEYLDWPSILSRLKSYSFFNDTQELLERPIQCLKENEIEIQYNSIEYLTHKIDKDHFSLQNILSPLDPALQYFQLIKSLSKGRELSLIELHHLALILEKGHLLLKEITDWPPLAPLKSQSFLRKDVHSQFLAPLRQFISKDGSIDFLKHPILGPLILKIKSLESSLKSTLSQVIKSRSFKDCLQYPSYDVIEDRYVLPLSSDKYRSEHGTIISRSNSGLTLLVAPSFLKDQNQELIILKARLESEQAKIARDFSCILMTFYQYLLTSHHFLSLLDLHNSKAEYSLAFQMVRPKITKDGEIILKNFFHPLIDDPVRNSIDMDSSLRGFVISGPNTGGKTVTLKSLAISFLFSHVGIFAPADFASFPYCDRLYFFSHDHQDLEKGLSSFSAESKNYLLALEDIHTYKRSFIFFDEIFNTTSSEEASALALALTDYLLEGDATNIFLSTHHHLLKIHLHRNPQFFSSHMGFNDRNLKPTYKLRCEGPGASMAIPIFSSLNEKAMAISKRANYYLESGHETYETLLKELHNKNTLLDQKIKNNIKLNLDLNNTKKSLEANIEFEIMKRTSSDEEKYLALYNKCNLLFYDIKASSLSKSQSSQKLSEIHHEYIEISQKNSTSESKEQPPPQISVGKSYYCDLFQSLILVKKYDRNKVTGIIGRKKVIVPISSLQVASPSKKIKRPREVAPLYLPTDEYKLEYNCRGMRLDDFKSLVEKALLGIQNESIPFCTFIHGHGEGILKNYLRKSLRSYKDLQWDNLEGNDGCTKVSLI